jgi:hypothetical protein
MVRVVEHAEGKWIDTWQPATEDKKLSSRVPSGTQLNMTRMRRVGVKQRVFMPFLAFENYHTIPLPNSTTKRWSS